MFDAESSSYSPAAPQFIPSAAILPEKT